MLRRPLVVCLGLSCLAWLSAACAPSKPTAPASSSTPTPAQVLWGDMKPIVSVKELMRYMIDPASDNIFDAVKIVQTKTGTVEKLPKTEEDWEKIRIGAVTLAEGVYLLKVPRPFAPAGDNNDNTTGPDATELTPDPDRGEAGHRSGPLEREDRGAEERRPRSARDREDEKDRRVVGGLVQPRSGVRDVPHPVLVSGGQSPARESRSTAGGAVRQGKALAAWRRPAEAVAAFTARSTTS